LLVTWRIKTVKNKIKVVIPAAGAGKRLFPHTFTKPKPMVYIAGKPIIGHILDRMIDVEPEEIIMVVGYKKNRLYRMWIRIIRVYSIYDMLTRKNNSVSVIRFMSPGMKSAIPVRIR
jgi:UTP-glucose-1-phosphate uridylyltransferase